MNKFDKQFWIPYIILLALTLIRLIPFLYPESRTWGFNHLIFLPTGYSIAFFVIATVALILPFVKKSEIWGERFIDWFSNTFFEAPRKYLNRAIFILFFATLFIIFAAPTHFLGDSYANLNILDRASGVYVELDQTAVFKWSEIGVMKFMIFVRYLIGESSDNRALLSFQIISILSGVITIWFFIKISQIATKDKTKRLLIIGSSFLSGTLLLFFGYAEYYHIIWAFHTAYLYFGLKYINSTKGLITAWLILLVGIAFHLQTAIFLPATLYVTFSTGRGLFLFRRYKRMILSMLGILAFGIVAITIYKYTTDLYIEDMFLKMFQGKPIDPDYAVFSLSHLLDIANEFILISPLIFLMLAMSIKNIKNILKDNRLIFLGLSAIGCLIFLFAIDPLLGMPRDWDLFSLTIYTPAVFTILLLPKIGIDSLKKFIVSIMIILTIGSMPFFVANLDRDKSIMYFKHLMKLDSAKALYAYVCLHDYYRSTGENEKIGLLEIIFKKNYPQMKQYNRAMTAMDNGNLDMSLTLLNKIKPNKYDGDYQRVWGRYFYMRGNNIRALEYLDRAIQLRNYNSIYYWQRAMIYVELSQNDKALDDLQYAHDLDNSSLRVLDGLSFMYYSAKKYDSSIFYANKMVQIDPGQIGAYYMLANSYYNLKNYNAAYQNARLFIEKTEGATIYNNQREQLLNMIGVISSGSKKP